MIYVGKAKSLKKRVASHFSGPHPVRPGASWCPSSTRSSPRSSPTEAEALLAEQNFIKQYKPRFNIRLRDDKSYPYIAISPRRGVPARLLHARAPPPRPRVLRPLLQRQEGARDARPARQGLPVPLLRRRRARPAQRLALPRLLHQALRGALRRLRRPRGVPPLDRRRHRLPLRALQGDRARADPPHERGRRGPGVRAGRARPQPPARRALPARAPARRQRVGRDVDAVAVAVEGADANAQVFQVRDGVLSDRQSFYLANEGERRAGRGRRGVRAPVLRDGDGHSPADRRPAGGRGAAGAGRGALGAPRGAGGAARGRARATSVASSSWPSATPRWPSTRSA